MDKKVEKKKQVRRYEIGLETYKLIPKARWNKLIKYINNEFKDIEDHAVSYDVYNDTGSDKVDLQMELKSYKPKSE
jgi:hypothetical protein